MFMYDKVLVPGFFVIGLILLEPKTSNLVVVNILTTLHTHPSDSSIQQEAQGLIIRALEQKLGFSMNMLESAKIPLKDSSVELDGYSDKLSILCEVYAHIGKMKGKQFDKIISDTMKMILIEKILGKSFRKILAVCDVDIEVQLNGSSWKSLVTGTKRICSRSCTGKYWA